MIGLMPNTGLAIKLQPAERMQLEKWESSHGTPQRVALRCRIVLGAVAGQDNVAIAEGLGVSRPTVQLWRKRVCQAGIGEVWQIAPGRGRKAQYTQAKRDGIIHAGHGVPIPQPRAVQVPSRPPGAARQRPRKPLLREVGEIADGLVESLRELRSSQDPVPKRQRLVHRGALVARGLARKETKAEKA
jgi:hypothetical protein